MPDCMKYRHRQPWRICVVPPTKEFKECEYFIICNCIFCHTPSQYLFYAKILFWILVCFKVHNGSLKLNIFCNFLPAFSYHKAEWCTPDHLVKITNEINNFLLSIFFLYFQRAFLQYIWMLSSLSLCPEVGGGEEFGAFLV